MQLVLSLSPGGTERLVIAIVRALRHRIESMVCCLDEPGAWAAELTDIGVPVVALGRRPGFHPSLARRLARLMKQHAVEVVHCHHYTPYVYGLLASTLTPGVRVIFTEHGRLANTGPSPKRRLVNPFLSRWPSRICAVSSDLRQHMIREGFPADRIEVVHNGVDPGPRPQRSQRRSARKTLDIADDALIIGTVGRLYPVKNLDALLQAQAIVARAHPGACTVIVGDGPERSTLEARATALGVSDAVVFTGYRADVRFLMSAFDIYVNCSTYEGVSLTILEAMAAGLPVIATPVGGNPEVVVDRTTGLLVPGRGPTLAGAIAELLDDPGRRGAMGDAGRWRVIRHFSIARMVDDYARAYLGSRTHASTNAPMDAPSAAETMSVSDATRSIV